jgi:hypothetical protein
MTPNEKKSMNMNDLKLHRSLFHYIHILLDLPKSLSKSTGKANTEIDLSKLQRGVYMVKVFNGTAVISRSKIVKL